MPSPRAEPAASPFLDRRALLSVFFLFLTFEPLGLWPFAFVALVPWFDLLARSTNVRAALRGSFWICFLFSCVTFYWVAYVVHTFGALPWPLAIIALLLFAAVGQPQFYLLAVPLRSLLLHVKGETRSLVVMGWMLLAALFYAGSDWVLPKLFVDTLGHSWIHAKIFRQSADIGGPAFLTFAILVVNVALYTIWDSFFFRNEPSWLPALKRSTPITLTAIALIVGLTIYGKHRLAQHADLEAKPTKTLRAAAIQANIGDIEKLASESGYGNAAERVLKTYYELSDQALEKNPRPQVLLWPETAYPSTFRSPETSGDFARDKELESYVTRVKTPLAFGGYDRDLRGLSYNSVFYLEPDGRDSRYSKTILIPFGEFIPGADLFPIIKRLFPMVGFFGKGPGSVVREVVGVKTQPVICYEVLFPNFVRDAVIQGAEILFNFTNDSWFGPVGAPYYHLHLAAFRSIEMRVPQLRVTNTGFTAWIDPSGEIRQRTQLFKPEVLNLEIPILSPTSTLVKKWGDWFGLTAFLFSAGVMVLGWNEKNRKLPP